MKVCRYIASITKEVSIGTLEAFLSIYRYEKGIHHQFDSVTQIFFSGIISIVVVKKKFGLYPVNKQIRKILEPAGFATCPDIVNKPNVYT